MPHLIYLRKSRADLEAEAHGEMETLARHERALLELAKRMKLDIGDIYREIVSGETIASRPQMQRLLSEVESGQWDGVLVMEVERLARGDSIDQGIVVQAFKISDTKIITPLKVYDPNNEYDEEYFEFGLFMSRREYKTVNRRLQRGRAASAKEGKFLGSCAPYGYRRVSLTGQKGATLEPVPAQAEVVRLIFDLYVTGEVCVNGVRRRFGIQALARRLNELHIPSAKSADYWNKGVVHGILTNPTYAGMIRWGWHKTRTKVVDGEKVLWRPRNYGDDCIIAQGLHPAIVDKALFERAQQLLAELPPVPVGYKNAVRNPLAGILVCGVCGRKLVLRKGQPGKQDYIVCHMRDCPNVGTPYHCVEAVLLDSLRSWLDEYKLSLKAPQSSTAASTSVELMRRSLKKLDGDLAKLEKQKSSLHDLLEQGVYDVDIFLSRSRELSERTAAAQTDRARISEELGAESTRLQNHLSIVPKVEHLLSCYTALLTPAEKNDLLKEVVEKAVYTKTQAGKRNRSAPFDLILYPRLPRRD
ncbi:MAG: recombinase family protein [Oscillospiraceae bacterium]|jgi:DNA invertase Pin-like site-specific DNA recombinase|nr:recombinase family protein [Oscillospiraceae bacterium]